MAFENWRFNPFTGVTHSTTITEEEHTIEYHSDWNAYGIQLDEAPALESPSSVVVVEDVTGGSTFTEVPKTQAPSSGEYRVDYDSDGYYGTGRIEFNSADNGKDLLVSYKGNGYIVKNEYSSKQQFTVPMNMVVTGDADIGGAADITGKLTLSNDLDVAGDVSIDGGVNGNTDFNNDVSLTGGDLSITGNLDVSGLVDLNGAVDIDSSNFDLNCDSLNIDNNGINILTGKTIKHNSNYCLGYLNDGTPLYCAWLSGSMGSGSAAMSISHGISNAETNKRIFCVNAHIAYTSTPNYMTQVAGSDSSAPVRTSYTDTLLYVTRTGTTGAYTVYVFIIYK